MKFEFLHVPGRGGAAFGAQAAVDAEVFVLEHEAAGLRQRSGGVERLVEIDGRRGEALAQIVFVAVARDGQAQQRTDVDAGVALDALGRGEDGLDVAIEAALHFARGLLGVEARAPLRCSAARSAAPDRRAVIFWRGAGL